MSKEHTFDVDCDKPEEVRRTLCDLAETVGRRLREAGKYAALAHLKLRWQGFKTITRQRPFLRPCCDDFTLREMALELLGAEDLIKPVRLVGFGVSRLQDEPGGQLDLFASESHDVRRREQLSRAVDQIRQRHGRRSIGRRNP